MGMRPIRGPEHREALAGGSYCLLIKKLRAAAIKYIIEVGHEHEMAGGVGLVPRKALGMIRFESTAWLVVLNVDRLNDVPSRVKVAIRKFGDILLDRFIQRSEVGADQGLCRAGVKVCIGRIFFSGLMNFSPILPSSLSGVDL